MSAKGRLLGAEHPRFGGAPQKGAERVSERKKAKEASALIMGLLAYAHAQGDGRIGTVSSQRPRLTEAALRHRWIVGSLFVYMSKVFHIRVSDGKDTFAIAIRHLA
jgi:hypothetical protein